MKICLLPFVTLLILVQVPKPSDGISYTTVNSWAQKLGFELSQLGKYVTNVEKFHESYKEAQVTPRDGNTLVHEIAKDIKAMMELKISAIKRIMDVAETSALSAPDEDPPKDFTYIDAKNHSILLTHNSHFGGRVNMSKSAVHVPTNVYAGAKRVIRAIKWSEVLDKTFINNYELDPSLSWQYFGSATGFMRQYPAISWDTKTVDLFDCRTRSWYIEAATSPKDMLILVDTSGSMTGLRKEIARHVINNILDTLGNNDYVNIITFSNETKEVVPCFSNTLVQANLANIRELKNAINDMVTERIANFSMVLDQAFEMLQIYRETREGSRCNQAIMLITDGVPDNYKEIFKTYNWANNPENPEQADMPVRVFTYLIGREVADVREVKWMACANRGYYVHLSTLAEVREQVLNYIPVMARPLVLGRKEHPTIWTPVYADITDPKMTDWLWEQEECAKQKERLTLYRKVKKMFTLMEEQDRRFVKKRRRLQHQSQAELHGYKYKLMTSVSMPVYDRRDNATRIADLLGVAGTDVPIEEIQRFMKPHMLGVNGYAFIVTNNGYILIHPDLRPVFQGILKPSYNSVDMAEVELMDQGHGPREFEEGILMLRNDVINQSDGSVTLHTKYHYEDMKRVGRVKRKYDYTGISNTPFTVVVSLPEYDHTGSYRIHATEEVHRRALEHVNLTNYFAGNNWRIHPEWSYCKYHYEGEHSFNSSEKEFLHFLERAGKGGWAWFDNKKLFQPPENSSSGSESSNSTSYASSKPDKNSYYCDRHLFQSLVFDAKVTQWFANPSTTREEKGQEFQQRFGFTLAFMATHSGLTRWQDFPPDEEAEKPDDHFSNMYPRAIDEIWYKRAVEQHYVHPDSFVFSIPIDDAGADNTTLVTASRAVFIGNESAKAPVAVVGFQFLHSALQWLFQNITYQCDSDLMPNCNEHCGSDKLACYLIDNHGYIIAGEDEMDAGRFFGEVRGPIMNSLVETGIYDKIRIFDYQAVCFMRTQTSNDASKLFTPWKNLLAALYWLFDYTTTVWARTGLWQSDYPENVAHLVQEDEIDEFQDSNEKIMIDAKDEKIFEQKVIINRTRPEPCDQEANLYLLRNVSAREYDIDSDSISKCVRPYVVQPVNFSNMILVVVDTSCPDTEYPIVSVTPSEIRYENNSLACQKALNALSRRRPSSCIRSHPKESEIKDLCGLASVFQPNWRLLAIFSFVIWFLTITPTYH